jgi:hypothetical protein
MDDSEYRTTHNLSPGTNPLVHATLNDYGRPMQLHSLPLLPRDGLTAREFGRGVLSLIWSRPNNREQNHQLTFSRLGELTSG